MSYRAALASTDGKVVNQHFGHTERFHIVELDDKGYQYIGTRETGACCNNKNHEISSFERTAEILADVQAIIVSRIGTGAADFLESRGFVVYEAPFFIEDILQKIVDDRLYEVDEWRSHTKN